jgi:hypothetical protein
MKKEDKDEAYADREVFTTPNIKIRTPWVTIMPNSTLLFNAGFVHRAKIKKSSHVILAFTRSKNTVDFQFTSDDKAAGALTLHHFRKGGTSVESRTFFNYFLLNASELAGRYTPIRMKIPKVGEVWTIDLDAKLPRK